MGRDSRGPLLPGRQAAGTRAEPRTACRPTDHGALRGFPRACCGSARREGSHSCRRDACAAPRPARAAARAGARDRRGRGRLALRVDRAARDAREARRRAARRRGGGRPRVLRNRRRAARRRRRETAPLGRDRPSRADLVRDEPRARGREPAPRLVASSLRRSSSFGAVTADGRLLATAGGVRVPPGQRRVSFAWSGVSLAAPERVRFRYRLDGFDSRWSEPVAAAEAVYANLAPGPYAFRVGASGGDGLWNGPEEVLTVSVAPAAWQTWWFQLAALLAAASAARLAYGWRSAGDAAAQCALRRAPRGADADRARAARHPAAGLRERLDAAARGRRAGARGGAGPPAARARAAADRRGSSRKGASTVRGLRSGERDSFDLGEAFSRVPRRDGRSLGRPTAGDRRGHPARAPPLGSDASSGSAARRW